MKEHCKHIGMLVFVLLVGGCASQPHPQTYDAPGFFLGLWHGLIMIPSLLGSVFMDDVRIYAFPNDGILYDIGFVIGAFFDIAYIASVVVDD